MSDLTQFRDHCLTMADPAAHVPTCLSLRPRVTAWEVRFSGLEPFEPPHCDGCVPESDRRLFARLASEVDAYLVRDDEPLALEGIT